MAEYWSSSLFFFFAFLWTERRKLSASAWSSAKCYCGNTTGNSEGAVSLHFGRSGRQSRRGIWFILPAREAWHKIMSVTLVAKGSLCE